MEGKGLGRRINMVRKDRGFTYLLRDALEDNKASKIQDLTELRERTSPSQQEIAVAMIRAVLERREGQKDQPGGTEEQHPQPGRGNHKRQNDLSLLFARIAAWLRLNQSQRFPKTLPLLR